MFQEDLKLDLGWNVDAPQKKPESKLETVENLKGQEV